MSFIRIVLFFLCVLAIAPLAAQSAFVTTTDFGKKAIYFPNISSGLPNPTQVVTNVTTMPGAFTFVGPDKLLLGELTWMKREFENLYYIDLTTNTLIDTIKLPTGPFTNIAVDPTQKYALLVLPRKGLVVIDAPFSATSTIHTIGLTIGVYLLSKCIEFDPNGRAFILGDDGIAVLDPPYTKVEFVIPRPEPDYYFVALDMTPDGKQMLITNEADRGIPPPDWADQPEKWRTYQEKQYAHAKANPSREGEMIYIYDAPYTKDSEPSAYLTIEDTWGLWSVAITPDGKQALVTGQLMDERETDFPLFCIEAPFNEDSVINLLPITGLTVNKYYIDISPDGQYALLSGVAAGRAPAMPIVLLKAPFTNTRMTQYLIDVTGGDGWGMCGFAPTGGGGTLNPPSNLTAVKTGIKVELNWQDNSTNEIGFEIQRDDHLNRVYQTIANVGANVTQYTDTLPANVFTPTYRIRAIGGDGSTSAFSAEANATAGNIETEDDCGATGIEFLILFSMLALIRWFKK